MAWYNSTGRENHKSVFEKILQLCFQNSSTVQDQSARRAIQLTQRW